MNALLDIPTTALIAGAFAPTCAAARTSKQATTGLSVGHAVLRAGNDADGGEIHALGARCVR